MVRKIGDKAKDDQELETLLKEVPQATSNNLLHHLHRYVNGVSNDHRPFGRQAIHGVFYGDDDYSFSEIKYPFASSPRSGSSMRSAGSSSSLVSGVHDNRSSTPPSLEELKSSMLYGVPNYQNSFCLDSTVSNPLENLADDLNLCAHLRKMRLSNQYEKFSNFKDASIGKNGLLSRDISSPGGNNPFNAYRDGDYCNFKGEFSDSMGVQSPFPPSPMRFDAERNPALAGLPWDYKMGNLFGSRPCSTRAGTIHSQFNGFSGSVCSPWQRRQLVNNYHYGGNSGIERTASLVGHALRDPVLYARQSGMNLTEDRGISGYAHQSGMNLMKDGGISGYAHQNGMNLMEDREISGWPDSSLCANLRPYLSVQDLLQYNLPMSNARAVPSSNVGIPPGGLETITNEGSFIIQGEGLNYFPVRGSDCLRGQINGDGYETSSAKHLQRSELGGQHQVLGSCTSPSARSGCSTPLVPEYNSLEEVQGYIYLLAKDQHGCRFLQRVFDEDTPEDVQVIFSEIIEHVVELMMNPFGNYLMQKLLEVCNEEQRMQILLMITKEPGQLVTISLNTYGTRVIQKLIETFQTRKEISLVVSVLELGFLDLIKDLNGNHVIQRCLQCLSNEDNKFIFVAAAKYCVDIATHQHGCCVLQRCIGRSWGEHRKQLVAEISANAFLLAQDQYGNYVVQYILELRIPSATASIISQFQGNYVHLSTQKFSSHVVEKCLAVFNVEHRARVILELLSAPHFEQLLQDPYANYVIQSALRHSEGHVHNRLVGKIESYKAISRNSPYSKKIFSQKLLKK